MNRVAYIVILVLTTACRQAAETPETAQPAPAGAATAARAAGVTPTAGWTVMEGIETPESAYYDADSGFIFVSQIAGQPTDRDGNGRIVKLNGDGSVVSAAWVTGLNAPKGLRAHQGTLWTADLDEVIGIDI